MRTKGSPVSRLQTDKVLWVYSSSWLFRWPEGNQRPENKHWHSLHVCTWGWFNSLPEARQELTLRLSPYFHHPLNNAPACCWLPALAWSRAESPDFEDWSWLPVWKWQGHWNSRGLEVFFRNCLQVLLAFENCWDIHIDRGISTCFVLMLSWLHPSQSQTNITEWCISLPFISVQVLFPKKV